MRRRTRFPRFRLRTLMIAIAVLGAGFAAGMKIFQLRRLTQSYRQKVAHYSQEEAAQRRLAVKFSSSSAKLMQKAESLRQGHLPEEAVSAGSGGAKDPLDTAPAALSEELREALGQIDQRFARELADHKEEAARTERGLAASAMKHSEYYARLRQKYERAARRPWVDLARDPVDPGGADDLSFIGDWPTPPRVLDQPLMSRPTR